MKEKDKEKDIDSLLEVIETALNLVEEPYFNLKTTYEPDGIVRERVFCYELYYRMRNILEFRKEIKLSLNGEVDKRGHIEFEEEDRKNPDFVFHTPGDMRGNAMVVEVKGKITNSYLDKCLKDFETIVCFISRYRYKVGVFVLYNYSECPFELVESLQRQYGRTLSDKISKKVFVICKKYGENVEKKSLYGILHEQLSENNSLSCVICR